MCCKTRSQETESDKPTESKSCRVCVFRVDVDAENRASGNSKEKISCSNNELSSIKTSYCLARLNVELYLTLSRCTPR